MQALLTLLVESFYSIVKDVITEENKTMLQLTLNILLYLSWYDLVVKEYHPFSLKLDLALLTLTLPNLMS